MKRKVLLIRHAKSTVNEEGDLAFENREAPLTDVALNQQIPDARRELVEKYGLELGDFKKPVLASEYRRTGDTARALGFNTVHTLELLNESDIYHSDELRGVNVIEKHVAEGGWLPDQERARGRAVLEHLQSGKLDDYDIIFSHGMVIAGILSELNKHHGFEVVTPDPKRGLVPLQAQITEIEV